MANSWSVCSGALHERLSKYHVMLEEQQGTNYRLTGELAAKEEQILRLKQALDERKSGHSHQGKAWHVYRRLPCHSY